MSNKVLHRVWECSQARGAARCLMLALADVADERGIAYPGVDYLAEMINESRDYTDALIKRQIEAGELFKIAGRGRGVKTRFAVLCGLPPDKQEQLKGVLQNPFSNPKKGQPTTPLSEEKGYSKTPIPKGGFPEPKRGTLSDSNDRPDAPAQSGQTPIDANPDPMIHGGGGGGGATRADKSNTEQAAEPEPRHVAYLLGKGMEAAHLFAHLDPDAAIRDFDARRLAGVPIGTIVNRWKKHPPRPGDTAYEQQRPAAQARAGRPASPPTPDPAAARAKIKPARRDGW